MVDCFPIEKYTGLLLISLKQAKLEDSFGHYQSKAVFKAHHATVDLAAEEGEQTVSPPRIEHNYLQVFLLADRDQPLFLGLLFVGLLYADYPLAVVADAAVESLHIINPIKDDGPTICTNC